MTLPLPVLARMPDVSDEDFLRDVTHVTSDLQKLKKPLAPGQAS